MAISHTEKSSPTGTTRDNASVVLLAVVVLVGLVLAFLLIKPFKVLPYLAEAPAYSLVDQHGETVSSADLQGHVVLYDFIYTHCTTVCPAMTGQMLQIQKQLEKKGELGEDVILVSITFDPERDTPERLQTYSELMNTGPDSWLWLTGELIPIKQLVGGEFGVYFEQIPLDEAAADAAGLTPEERENGYDFIHATVFTLVDEQGNIRAEYHELLDVDQIMRDIDLVVREKNAQGVGRLLMQLAHLTRAYP